MFASSAIVPSRYSSHMRTASSMLLMSANYCRSVASAPFSSMTDARTTAPSSSAVAIVTAYGGAFHSCSFRSPANSATLFRRAAARIADAQLEVRQTIGRGDTRDLHCERLALVDHERVGVDEVVRRVVADRADGHAFLRVAEVELRGVGRRVARADLLVFHAELHAIHGREDVDADEKDAGREAAAWSGDRHGTRRRARFVVTDRVRRQRIIRLRQRARLVRFRHELRRRAAAAPQTQP